MNIDFEVNEHRHPTEIMYGRIDIRGHKAFCDKVRELCEQEFGKESIV